MATFLKIDEETVIRFSDISRMSVNCAAGNLLIQSGNSPTEDCVEIDNLDLTIDEACAAVECAGNYNKSSCTWDELWAFSLSYYAPVEEEWPTMTEEWPTINM